MKNPITNYLNNAIKDLERQTKAKRVRAKRRHDEHKAFHDEYLAESPRNDAQLNEAQIVAYTAFDHGGQLPNTRINDVTLSIDYHAPDADVDDQPPRDIPLTQRLHNIASHIDQAQHYTAKTNTLETGNLGRPRPNSVDLRQHLVKRNYTSKNEPWTPSSKNQWRGRR